MTWPQFWEHQSLPPWKLCLGFLAHQSLRLASPASSSRVCSGGLTLLALPYHTLSSLSGFWTSLWSALFWLTPVTSRVLREGALCAPILIWDSCSIIPLAMPRYTISYTMSLNFPAHSSCLNVPDHHVFLPLFSDIFRPIHGDAGEAMFITEECAFMHAYAYMFMCVCGLSCARPGASYEVQWNEWSLHGFLEVPRVLWFSFGSVMCQSWGILLLSFWQFISFVRGRFWWFGPEQHEEDILDWMLAKPLPIIVLYHSNNINRKWCLIVFNSKQYKDEINE